MWKDKVDYVTVQDLLFSFDSDVGEGDSDKFKSEEKSYYSIDKKLIHRFESETNQHFCCPYLYQSLKIHNDGSIDACSPKEAPKVGHVDQGIHEAWNGDKILKIRKMHEEGKWAKVPECAKCDIPYIELNKKMIEKKWPKN